MTREEALFEETCQPIFNWQQRMESVTGLECYHIRELCKKGNFSVSELVEAQQKDMDYFKGLATEVMCLC